MKRFLLLLVICVTSILSFAKTAEYIKKDGYIYKKTSDTELTLCGILPNNKQFVKFGFYSNLQCDTLTFPSNVTVKKVQYTVTGVDFEEMRNNAKTIYIKKLIIPETIEKIVPPTGGWSRQYDYYYHRYTPFFFNFEELVFPQNISELPDEFLRGNEEILKVCLPKKLKVIGKRFFYNCSSLKEVTLPADLEVIGDSAFYECKNLESIGDILSKNLKYVGNGAFYECENLESVGDILSNNLNYVGNRAFYKCKKLESIGNIFSKDIGCEAFYGCRSLSRGCNIKAQKIGDYAFREVWVSSVYVSADTIGNRPFGVEGYFDRISIGEVTFGKDFVYTGDYALLGDDGAKAIGLPQRITFTSSRDIVRGENDERDHYKRKRYNLVTGFQRFSFIPDVEIYHNGKKLDTCVALWDCFSDSVKKRSPFDTYFLCVEYDNLKKDYNKWLIKDEFESTQQYEKRTDYVSKLGFVHSRLLKLMGDWLNQNRDLYSNFTLKNYDADKQLYALSMTGVFDTLVYIKIPAEQAAKLKPAFKQEMVRPYYNYVNDVVTLVECDINFDGKRYSTINGRLRKPSETDEQLLNRLTEEYKVMAFRRAPLVLLSFM